MLFYQSSCSQVADETIMNDFDDFRKITTIWHHLAGHFIEKWMPVEPWRALLARLLQTNQTSKNVFLVNLNFS